MKYLELFAGIGGFRRALELASVNCIDKFECIGFSEIDEYATKSYKANYNTTGELELGDISLFTSNPQNIENLPDFDLLVGGFPCQSFSVLGNSQGFNDPRGQLFFRIVDILKIKKPKYVLLENVKRIMTHDDGNTLRTIRQELESLGYQVVCDIFNTKDFSLPQNRSRCFIFAIKGRLEPGKYFNAELTKCYWKQYENTFNIIKHKNMSSLLKEHVDSKYFLSNKMKWFVLNTRGYNNDTRKLIDLEIARTLLATMHMIHRADTDNYYSQEFIESKGKSKPCNLLLDSNLKLISDTPIRCLTPEEAWVLQGFPEGFVKHAREAGVKDKELYRQVGNAVSVNVVYAIIKFLQYEKVL